MHLVTWSRGLGTMVTLSKAAWILLYILIFTQLLCRKDLKSDRFSVKLPSTVITVPLKGLMSEQLYFNLHTGERVDHHHQRRKYLASRIPYNTGQLAPTYNLTFVTKDILHDGDISSNPGPTLSVAKRICGSCTRTLAKNHRAISCCSCGCWYHIKCAGLTPKEFNAINKNNSYQDWVCSSCQLSTLPFATISNESFEQLISDGTLSSTISALDYNSGDLIDELHTDKDALLIAHLNINSIAGSKLFDAKQWLYSMKIDILILAETKIDDSFPDSHFMVEGYQLLRRDNRIGCGGLVIYIKDNIPIIRLQHLESDRIQNIAFIIPRILHDKNNNNTGTRKGVLIHGIYRPPSLPKSIWYDEVFKIVNSSQNDSDDIVILGDLNCDLLHPDHGDKDGRHLLDLCDILNLTCLVDKVTRPISNSLLDVILTNDSNIIQNAQVIECDISDHNLIYCLLKYPKILIPSKVIQYRNYKHFNKDNFQKDVASMPIHIADIFDDVDDQAWVFLKLFSDLVDEHAPLKSMRVRGRKAPYMTPEWRRAKQLKKSLHKQYKKLLTTESFNAYKKQRNICTAIRRKAIRNFFKVRSAELNGNPKKFWKTFGAMSHAKKKKSNLGQISLKESGQIVTDKTKLCNIFNNYFSTITENLTCPRPEPLNTFFSHNEYNDHCSVQKICDKFCAYEPHIFKVVTVSEVSKIIHKLKSSTSPGHDMVQAQLLKDCVNSIAPKLTDRINSFIRTGAWPTQFKLGAVTPVFKGNDPCLKENYRPITVLPVFNQIFERVISKRLNYFMQEKFSPFINAYRKHYGCETALLRLVEDWKEKLDNNVNVGIVFNDLSKAFDVIEHKLLLAKLRAYGLSEISLKLMKSYLSNRTQFVKLNDCRSVTTTVDVGVPQGSVLGPVLFNIFFNDIFYFVQLCSLTAYADDSQLFFAHKDFDIISLNLSSDLSNLKKWFDRNFMQINPSKAEALVLSRTHSEQLNIPFDNITIKSTNDKPIKLLGVWFDRNLNFHKHIAELCKSVSRQLAVLSRMRNILPKSTKLLLYHTHFRSLLNYSSTVWHFCNTSDAKKLEKVNHRALSFVFNDFKTSYEDLLTNNNILSLKEQRLRNFLIYAFKAQTDLAPSINHIFNIRATKHNLRGGTKMIIPPANTTRYGLNSFKYIGVKLWNMLDQDIKTSENLTYFKNKLSVKYIKELVAKL